MNYFTESNDILHNPESLRRRLKEDGYLFVRDILPKEDVLYLRQRMLEFCREEGWLREGSVLMDGLTDHEPLVEGSKAWRPVYAKIQAQEAFHRLKLHENMYRIMADLFEEQIFALPMTIARTAFPRDNARGTQPHQDWFYVGGSTETLSCWAPMGDIPVNVGGLKLLKGSHKAGFLSAHEAPGPGGHAVLVDPELDWYQTDYRAGDVLIFKSLTVHAAAENHTEDVLRLSMDFRYTGLSHSIVEGWLQPHFSWLGDPFTWDTLDKEWRNSPTARYWEQLPKIKTKAHEKIAGK